MNFVQPPRTDDDFAANVRAARVHVGGTLGLNLSDGSPGEFANLSQADQIRLTDEVSAFIVNNQGLFSDRQVELARARVNAGSFRAPVEAAPGIIDESAAFVKAYGETFGETVEAAGSIVGKTAGNILGVNLGMVVIVAAGVAILYFGAPYVLPRLKAAFGK